MTDTRSYDQNCSLALGLDLLGERWTLLVIRELARGPKRFTDLLDSLPGLGRSMLATRLKHLEQHDVINHADAGYALAPRGERLARALGPLMLWGLELDPHPEPDTPSRCAWLAMNMQAMLRSADTRPPLGTYSFAVGDERFYLHVGHDDITLRDGAPPHPADAVATTTPRTFYKLASGHRLSDTDAHIDGDQTRLDELLRLATITLPGS